MVEKPAGSSNNIWFTAIYFSGNHSRILVDGCRYNVPFYRFIISNLCL